MTAGARYRRSPFLLAGWQGSDLVLLDCDSVRQFRIDQRLAELLCHLDRWRDVDDLCADGHTVGEEELAKLAELGVVEVDDGDAGCDDADAGCWDPISLAAQRRQTPDGTAALTESRRDPSPPPATKPHPEGAVTALPTPQTLSQPLSEVLHARRSLRRYGTDPLGLGELSSLLFHAAHIDRAWHDDQVGGQTLRPFPSAGARNELEVYVVANDVAGLTSGAHYYDAHEHQLVLCQPRDAGQERLNRFVHQATGEALNREPPAVLLITAVFARTLWKYGDIGLKLIYADTGSLCQTLYLAATSLGLAPCAIGAAPELDTAQWLGLDPLVESQVGCVLVGPHPPP